ncbi:MAG: integrase [Saprospirales bacterium]|nr:MAG: integrase [Saprospirales bacterium]
MMDSLKRFESYLLHEKRCSEHTLIAYRKDLMQFRSFCEEMEVDFPEDVKVRDVRSWLASMSINKIQSSTINRKLSSIKSFYNFCLRRNLIKENPALNIKGMKKMRLMPSAVKDSELQNMFDSIYSQIQKEKDAELRFSMIRDLTVLEILYSTGMRRSELISLTVDGLDFSRGTIKVFGKGRKEREIPLSDLLIHKLDHYLNLRAERVDDSERALIITDQGKAAYDKFIYLLVKRHLTGYTSLDKKSPHVLRHSFATHLTENGAQLPEIKELMGHTSLAATEVYLSNSTRKLREIYRDTHPR